LWSFLHQRSDSTPIKMLFKVSVKGCRTLPQAGHQNSILTSSRESTRRTYYQVRMNTQQHIDYWLTSASHDLDAAETLFQNQKYDWCLFIGHLVVEKTLKAFYVRDCGEVPPRIHNLVRLAENSKLSLSDEQLTFLADINDFNIETRYPDYKFIFYKTCTREFAQEQFSKIKEMYRWLLSQMKS